jgi:hypothetical protein
LSLTNMGLRVHGFEQFDLNNQSNNASTDPRGLFSTPATGNTLQLTLGDVLGETSNVVSGSTQHMTILGGATSTVALDGTTSLTGSNWAISGTQNVNGVTFDIYHNSTTTSTVADLLIQQGVHVV